MKNFKQLLILALLAIIGTGYMWGETYTLGWGTATGSAGTYTNFTATSGSVTNVLSFSSNKGSSATEPAYNSGSSELRLYYNSGGSGGYITLTPGSGVTITGFVMTTSTTPSVKYSVNGGTATSVSASNNTYTVTGISASSSLKIQNVNTTNTQLRIKTIQITYTTSGGGGAIAPTITTDPVSANYAVGDNATNLSVAATASSGSLSYQWYSNTANSTTAPAPTALANCTTATYKPSTASAGTTYYFCKVTDSKGSTNSGIAAIKVSEPTGTFNKFTATTLVEGDYVLTYNTYTLANSVSSNRWTNGDAITNGAASLTNPDAAVVWHLSKSGDYWLLYNADVEKYAAGTSTKNQGSMVDMPQGGASNMMKWTATYVATGKWDFENYGRSQASSDSGNKYLRNNGTNGWACYASGTNGALTLYKKTLPKHAVTFTAAPAGGTVALSVGGSAISSGAQVEEGATVTVTPTPSTYYRIASVTKGGQAITPVQDVYSFTMPTSDVAVAVTFELIPVTAVTLNKSALELVAGATETLSVSSVTPNTARATVTWSSTNESVATVTSAGVVTAKTAGNAIIKATSTVSTSVFGSCALTVTAPTGHAIGITSAKGTVTANTGVDVADVLKNVAVVLTASPNDGYSINSWTVTGVDTKTISEDKTTCSFTMPDNDVTVVVAYTHETAVLKLHDANGESTYDSGNTHYWKESVTLPSTAAACSKTFMGWSANAECATAPEISKGASYTIPNKGTNHLYAVYATGGSTNETITKTMSEIVSANSYTVSSGNDATMYKELALNSDITLSTTGDDNCGSFWGTNPNHEWRLYQNKSGNAIVTAASGCTLASVKFTFGVSNTGALFNGNDAMTSGTAVSASGSSAAYTVGNSGSATNGQVKITAIEVKYTKTGSYSGYTTTCAATPTATPSPTALNDIAAAGAENGTITMTYTNVNTSGVSIDLYNNEACSEAFSGEWLEVDLDNSKNITYTIAANNSYKDARSAYIKLTAPAEVSGPADAVVVIPVSQVKKAAEFASLQDLVAADVNANTPVTVTFSNVVIKEMYEYNDKVCGVVFNIQKAGEDIKIYFNSQETISDWVAGGKLSGTLTDCPWKIYSDAWQLAPASGWAWANLEYTEPASVSSVVVSGNPSKTTYDVGEAFDPAGLTVIVTYSDSHVETITSEDDEWAYVSWAKDPATFAAEHIGTNKSVSVTATYNAVPSSATEISGLTVNKVAVTGVTLSQDAATLKAGKTLTLTATIAPENATYKTVNWSTSDGSVATVENGVVTAVAEGSATITATSTDDNTEYATCAITVAASINFAAGDWTLVTDAAELTVGSYVIIAAAESAKAMKSYDSGNNCKAEDATKSGDLLEYNANFGIFEIGDYEISAVTYKTFQDVNTDQYLYLNSNNNYLKAQDDKDENAAWTITSVSNAGVAVVTSKSQSTRTMRYNDNSALFACYTSGQADIALYKYFAPVPKVTYNKNTEDEVTNLPGVQKTVWESDAYKATIAAGPSRSGYSFTGWNSVIGGNGDAYAVGTKYSFAADITLYAQWEEIPTYSVTYNTTGSTGTTPVDANAYAVGDEVTLASASGLSNPGHFFDAWVATYVDGNEETQTLEIEDGKFTMPAFNVTVTATWARKSSDKWIKVTSTSQLVAGEEYIIASTAAYPTDAEPKSYYAISTTQNANNRKATPVDVNDGVLTGSSAMETLVLEDASNSMFAFKAKSSNQYLCTATGGNYLRSQAAIDGNSSWTITITDGVVSIVASNSSYRNVMQFNYASNNQIFACYASASQKAVALYYKAPKKEINDGESVSSSTVTENSDVVIHNGGTLTVNDNKQIKDLTVENGGKIVLSENKLTVVGTFAIETKMAGGTSGQLSGATVSNFAATDEAYIDITLGKNGDPNQWHAFTVPFPVDAMNGIYDLDGNKLANEVNYAIMEYDGSVRAQGKYGWKKIRTTLVPGTFYLMTVDGLRTTYRFKKKAGAALVAGSSKTVYQYPLNGGSTGDNGWNGVGNPTLRYGKVGAVAYVLNPESYEYEDKDPNSTNFVVGTPFFVVATADGSISMGEANASAAYAPRRSPAKGIENIKVAFGNEECTDYLTISASEDALNEYETGKDYLKMMMSSTPKVARIFSKAYGVKLCREFAPMSADKASYDLTLYVPANGEYVMSAPETEDADVYLTKDGMITWNLSMSECTLELNKGNNEGYGLLLVKKAPSVATGVESTEYRVQNTDIQKVIIDEHVYILRDGKMYGVDGKKLK